MIPSLRSEKWNRARSYLEGVIRTTAADSPLPGIRSMMQNGALSRVVLERLLDEYAAGGWLRIIPRGGIYRTARPFAEESGGTGCRIIDLVACHERNYLAGRREEFFPKLKEQLFNAAIEYNCAIRLHRVRQPDTVEDYRRISSLADSSGFMLLHTPTEEVAELFAASGKDTIHVMPDLPLQHGIRIVDSGDLIPRILGSAIRAGHTEIGYLHEAAPEIASHFHRERLNCFFRIMEEHRLPVRPEWVVFAPATLEGMRAAVDRLFAAPPYPELLIANDHYMPAVYTKLQQIGLNIGKNIQLLGHDGLGLVDELQPTVTTLAVSCTEIARLAWENLRTAVPGADRLLEVKTAWHPGQSFTGTLY